MLELGSNVDIAKQFGARYAARGQVRLAGSGSGLAGGQGQRAA